MMRRKDHGWAWVIAISACITRALYEGLQKAMAVLLPTLAMEFDQQIWVIGFSVSVMIVVGGIVAIVTGPLTSFLPPYQITMLCGISACIGLCCCTMASNWIMCAFSLIILTGIPMRFALVILFSSISDCFEKYYAIANCIACSGAALGLGVFAPLAQFFLDSYGWKGTMILLGGISLHLMVCGAVLKTSPDKGNDNPSYIAITEETGHEQESIITRILHWIKAKFELSHFQNPLFLTCLVTMFAMGYSWMGWVTYLMPYAKTKGLEPYEATSLATAGGVGYFIFSIVVTISLQMGIKPIFVLTFGISISGIAMTLYTISSNVIFLVVLSFIFGVSSASYIALLTICKDLIGGKVTQSLSWLSLVSAVGKSFSGFMTGWIYEMTGSYDVAFVTLGAVLLGAALLLCATIINITLSNKKE